MFSRPSRYAIPNSHVFESTLRIYDERISLTGQNQTSLIAPFLKADLFSLSNSTFHFDLSTLVSSRDLLRVLSCISSSSAFLRDLTFLSDGIFTSPFYVQSSSLHLNSVSFVPLDTNSVSHGLLPSLVDTSDSPFISLINCRFAHSQTQGHSPLVSNGVDQQTYVSECSFTNITLATLTNFSTIGPHLQDSWHTAMNTFTDCEGETNGVIVGDFNRAGKAVFHNNTHDGCGTIFTEGTDRSSNTVLFRKERYRYFVGGSVSVASIAVTGSSARVEECRFLMRGRYKRSARLRAIFFNSLEDSLTVVKCRFQNMSNTDGIGGTALYVTNCDSLWVGGGSNVVWISSTAFAGAILLAGTIKNAVFENINFDTTEAMESSDMSPAAGGIYFAGSTNTSFLMTNSTVYLCSSQGVGGGVTFTNLLPTTSLQFKWTWFVRNGATNFVGLVSKPGGSIVLGITSNADTIDLKFTSCRFRSRLLHDKGDDLYAYPGWGLVLSPSIFDCCQSSGSAQSIYIDGVTGSKDTNWIPEDRVDTCPKISYDSPYLFKSTLFHIIFWPILGTFFLMVICCPFCCILNRKVCHIRRCSRCFHKSGKCLSMVFCCPCVVFGECQDRKYYNMENKETHEFDGDEDMATELQRGKNIKRSSMLGYISAARNRFYAVQDDRREFKLKQAQIKKNDSSFKPASLPTDGELKECEGQNVASAEAQCDVVQVSGTTEEEKADVLANEGANGQLAPYSFQTMRDNLAMLAFMPHSNVRNQSEHLLKIIE
ncbi:hypothetical protein BLNAU_998 [Blattamonas nauphoetae]|uniref:Uncharacterized protein n=1 Tax=Blattamonas nauphoetae TaxID=2049346 RepID=A0ABQ9YJV1_9EUKA|nr:hypothetical protein BLNAU_998 [Blattamonas nauphoetae]